MEFFKRGSPRRIFVPALNHNLVADEHNDQGMLFRICMFILLIYSLILIFLGFTGKRIEASLVFVPLKLHSTLSGFSFVCFLMYPII